MIFNEREYGTQEISKNIRQEIKFRGVVLINVPVDRSKKYGIFGSAFFGIYSSQMQPHELLANNFQEKKGIKTKKLILRTSEI